MSDQGKRLMFSDSQAKKFVGKKLRIILSVTKFFTDEILCRLFFPIRQLTDLTQRRVFLNRNATIKNAKKMDIY